MSNDTADTSSFGPRVSVKMALLVADHNLGMHRSKPRTGCPGCLLASAGTRED